MSDLDRSDLDKLKEALARKERQRRRLNQQISHLQMRIHSELKAIEAREQAVSND